MYVKRVHQAAHEDNHMSDIRAPAKPSTCSPAVSLRDMPGCPGSSTEGPPLPSCRGEAAQRGWACPSVGRRCPGCWQCPFSRALGQHCNTPTPECSGERAGVPSDQPLSRIPAMPVHHTANGSTMQPNPPGTSRRVTLERDEGPSLHRPGEHAPARLQDQETPGPCAGHPAPAGSAGTHISKASLQKAVHFFLSLFTHLFAARNFSRSFRYVSEGHKISTYTQ